MTQTAQPIGSSAARAVDPVWISRPAEAKRADGSPGRRDADALAHDLQRRLFVKSGVTGLLRVSGRFDLPWQKSVSPDLSYMDNWPMVGDALIGANTSRAVLERKGAY